MLQHNQPNHKAGPRQHRTLLLGVNVLLSILLRCFDIEQTRNFYESVLGFSTASTANSTITVSKNGTHLIFTD